MSTLISELSTTPQLVFSEWISTLSSAELERESPREEQGPTASASSNVLPRMTLSSGSLRNLVVPSSIEQFAWRAFSRSYWSRFEVQLVALSSLDRAARRSSCMTVIDQMLARISLLKRLTTFSLFFFTISLIFYEIRDV